MKHTLWLRALPVALLLLLPTFVSAETVVATFADGKGSGSAPVTDVVDAYTGMAGEGWAAGWASGKSTSITPTYTVLGDGDTGYGTPVLDDNYLNAKGSVTVSGGRQCGTWRDYSDGIDPTQDHTIQFTVRINEDVTAANFSGTSDHYDIHDRVDFAYVSSTSGSTVTGAHTYAPTFCTWGISLRGAWTDYPTRNDHWIICGYDSGTSTAVYTDTGITPGTTTAYTFTLDFHMADDANGTYDVTIANGATTLFSGAGYGLSPAVDDDVFGAHVRETTGKLQFAMVASKDSGDGNNTRNMSIDGISIMQVPEPGTLALVLGLLLMGLVWRRK